MPAGIQYNVPDRCRIGKSTFTVRSVKIDHVIIGCNLQCSFAECCCIYPIQSFFHVFPRPIRQFQTNHSLYICAFKIAVIILFFRIIQCNLVFFNHCSAYFKFPRCRSSFIDLILSQIHHRNRNLFFIFQGDRIFYPELPVSD